MGNTCTFTGVMDDGAGGFFNDAPVTFDLVGPRNIFVTDNNRMVNRTQLTAITAGTGAFSRVVDRNDKLTPDGTVWRVECIKAGFLKYLAANADGVDVVTAPDLSGALPVFVGTADFLVTFYAIIAALPTDDPLILGHPFNNGGVLMISAGP